MLPVSSKARFPDPGGSLEGRHPGQLPVDLDPDDDPLSPVVETQFEPPSDGVFVFRHQGARTQSRPDAARSLDARVIEQLRSLGYLR